MRQLIAVSGSSKPGLNMKRKTNNKKGIDISKWKVGETDDFLSVDTGQDPDTDNFSETAAAFSAMLTQFIKIKEGHPHNREYKWSEKDLYYIQAALEQMTTEQRNVFRDNFKDYQIVKLISILNQGSA